MSSRPFAHRAARRCALSLGISLLAATSALAQGAARTPVIPPGTSASPTLTPGIKASGEMVYASGQLGMSRTDPDSSIQGQTKRALEATKRVFEAAGTTMANAVRCTVWLIDVKDFQGMNQAYREFWPDSPPARSTLVVAALVVQGAKVEIECTAAMPK